MKALQSDLARKLLADPEATARLREWTSMRASTVIVVKDSRGGQPLRLKPALVPPAT